MKGESSRKILEQAVELFRQAYQLQMQADVVGAIELYQASIAACPTAEAHTFLGWAYSFEGRFDEAIAECRRAIEIDPEFGNPWNDIGAYLIEQDRQDEAIPYLERATRAKRYESPCFPHFNLSRIFVKKGQLRRAAEELRRALEVNPGYLPARQALTELEKRLH
ncbi:MAG: tetratricopeptide repeat protein [Deltaproteobacteria bacterium]|nr:tetratricopeptide repeat protein [Deltaproteobacteria bacterium]